MKKVLLFALSAMFGMSAYAADEVVKFVDTEGNDISGKTIEVPVVSETEEDPFDGTIYTTTYAIAPVLVKNVSAANTYVKVTSNVTELSNGVHQICFNGNCVREDAVGKYEYKTLNPQLVKPDASKDLQAKWFPKSGATDGQCVVTYQAEIYDVYQQVGSPVPGVDFLGYGPSVTVVYTFNPAGGVEGVVADKEVSSVSYYNICGRQVANPESGLYIKRIVYTDGSVKTEKLHIN